MTQQLGLRTSAEQQRVVLQEYVSALKTIATIRTPIFLVLILALLFPLAAFAGVSLNWAAPPLTAKAQLQDPAAEAPTAWQVYLYDGAVGGMKLSAFVARLMTLLLGLAYLLAINVCLVSALGGTRHAIAAFYWTALLMIFLVPWHSWMGGAGLPMLFNNMDALMSADAQVRAASSAAGWLERYLAWGHYVAQFALFPFLGILAAWVADIRFGASYRNVLKQVQTQLEISVA